ncbi:PREDICTED: uncharacterized protein LOC109206376 [Nicotiana attenuata]|uniref:uncharacterized protein LOC109206376 n=1 Tax=Nicotiana attenuata TaxID=49451 RepID=UPI000905360C|nr:PREDICTED: uncharacterized protein LOC109206376 [Nicotiana attenuata]
MSFTALNHANAQEYENFILTPELLIGRDKKIRLKKEKLEPQFTVPLPPFVVVSINDLSPSLLFVFFNENTQKNPKPIVPGLLLQFHHKAALKNTFVPRQIPPRNLTKSAPNSRQNSVKTKPNRPPLTPDSTPHFTHEVSWLPSFPFSICDEFQIWPSVWLNPAIRLAFVCFCSVALCRVSRIHVRAHAAGRFRPSHLFDFPVPLKVPVPFSCSFDFPLACWKLGTNASSGPVRAEAWLFTRT